MCAEQLLHRAGLQGQVVLMALTELLVQAPDQVGAIVCGHGLTLGHRQRGFLPLNSYSTRMTC